MKPVIEKKGQFYWGIFEKTGSIKAFLLYHKAKTTVPGPSEKDKARAKGVSVEK